MKIGDVVRRKPIILDSAAVISRPYHEDEETILSGEVVYMHPCGWYHTVRFTFDGGSFLEAYPGTK